MGAQGRVEQVSEALASDVDGDDSPASTGRTEFVVLWIVGSAALLTCPQLLRTACGSRPQHVLHLR